MNTKSIPNFAAWREDNLAKIAEELYLQNLELYEALEQSRLDLKDAMNLVRALTLKTQSSLQEPAESTINSNSVIK